MKKLLLHTVGIFFILSLLSGCSTQKNTRASRTFHNITSYYNIYFNAKESVNSGTDKIDENIENDFTRVLPIYKSSLPSAAQLVKSDMDYAVIKASKLIEIHSITEKPRRRRNRTQRYQEFASQEEFNKWVDDSYVLMGKAYFYQHNFSAAITNLSYVVRRFPDEETKYEADVWLIRSYSELERYVEANEVIQAVQGDENFPRKLEKDLALATADYYMKQGEYTEAIKFLEIAISKITWKSEKARYEYIIAQLYEETGNSVKASEAFTAVTKMNPDYEMKFNAMINAAGVFSGEGDSEKLKKDLNKLLRDKKNVNFKDQIYYALGNLYLEQGDREQAIENYRMSVSNSFQNQFQRALSSVTLADIYFEDLSYREAQAYYDSAMIIIDNTYPNYEILSSTYQSLTRLVDNLVTVEREDSLQRIALMSENERDAYISDLIQKEEDRQRNLENLAMQGQTGQRNLRGNRIGLGTQQTGAGWYFYNPQTVSYGEVTFQQRWGRRPLEDDWRRSNKNTISVQDIDDSEELTESSPEIIREDDPLKKEYYTQDLPLTDSLMALSHNRIRDALYNAGKIFKSEFSNYPRSAESFEELIERYPENIYLLSSYYDLYDLYELMGNNERSNFYRNLLISEFPMSKYAQFLVNPNYFVEMEALKDSLNNLYQQTYEFYRSGRYSNVIDLTSAMKQLEPDSLILPKIDFMETVAQGVQTDIQNFEHLLEGFIAEYPQAEPTPLANEILRLVQDSALTDYQQLVDMGYINDEIQNEELLPENQIENDEFNGKFSYDGDLLHYFVITYPRDADIDLNRLKFDIANYNIDHYTKIDFDIETENLNDNTALVLVRALSNKENALIYHGAIIRNANVFRTLSGINYANFVISSTNYREMVNERSMTDYLSFFVKNYSRFVGSNFSEEEPEISPEEMMARAQQEEDALRERGTFVTVNTGASSIFKNDIDTTQNFVIAINDKTLSTRQALTDFADFNRTEYRLWNLALQLKTTSNYQLIVIKGIPTLNESMSYFRKVVVTRDLFESLGRVTYRNFLATDENLQKILDEDNVEDYMNFFRTNYIEQIQNQSQPSEGQDDVNYLNDNEEIQYEQIAEEPENETSIYNNNVEGEQLFVFVIPNEDVNISDFMNGIEEYNNSNYEGLKLEERVLDDFRLLVIISGIQDKQSAQQYSATLVQNRDLFTPLGEATYRNFVITPKNLEIFIQDKNILDYTDFYKRIYLNQ